jgi:inosine/xanthosine triphosphatase
MRVAVGSLNPVKVAATRAVLQRLYGADVVTIPIQVPSRVSRQPWGDAETQRGAVNRATAALQATAAGFGIGLEGGVMDVDVDGELRLFTSAWCAVIDRRGIVGIAGGANLLLPRQVGDDVRHGTELGAAIDRLTGLSNTHEQDGAIGVLTGGQISRQAAFEHVLTMAFARFLSPRYYACKD